MLAIMQLPAGHLVGAECWTGLSNLASLRSLHLRWGRGFTAEQLMALQGSLNSLPHLSDLSLFLDSDFRMNVEKNPRPPLCLQLPALRRLNLCEVRVPPFAFLLNLSLLEELTLSVMDSRSRFVQPFADRRPWRFCACTRHSCALSPSTA